MENMEILWLKFMKIDLRFGRSLWLADPRPKVLSWQIHMLTEKAENVKGHGSKPTGYTVMWC